MNADGTKQKRLTSAPSADASPAMSPDGRTIVYMSNGTEMLGFTLYRMNADGSGIQQLTQTNSDDPMWSPDGRRIVFRGDPPSNKQSQSGYGGIATGMIYTMNPDGTDQKPVRTGMSPQYSPDGKQFAFALPGDAESRIGTVDINGQNTRWLSPPGVYDENPTWSPDGQWVAFDSDPTFRSARSAYFAALEAGQGNDGKHDIYVMTRDGAHVTRLTQSLEEAGTNFRPNWGPDITGAAATRILPAPPTPLLSAPIISTVADEPHTLASGQLVYAVNDLQHAPFPSSLVLQSIETAPTGAPSQAKLASYRIQNVEGRYGPLLFDPQFSPGGGQLTVKLGAPHPESGYLAYSPFSSYQLYAWNLQQKQWRQVSSRNLYYPQNLWSPDEKRIALIAGGAPLGKAPGNLVGSDIRNGNMIPAAAPRWAQPLSLYVNDLSDGSEQLIVQNSTIAYNVCWADSQTLLYALLTPDQQKLWQQQRPMPKEGETAIRPNIYEYSLQTKKERLLIKDGHRPLVSPDGKWIAFYGSPKPQQPSPLNESWWLRPGWSSLIVAHRDGSQRRPLKRFEGAYPEVLWKGDGQNLITLHQTDYGAKARAEVEQWNFVTGAWRKIATLETSDTASTQRSAMNPQFEAIKLSNNGRYLWVRVVENTPSVKVGAQPTQVTFVRAVELDTGNVTTITRIEGDGGMDWHN